MAGRHLFKKKQDYKLWFLPAVQKCHLLHYKKTPQKLLPVGYRGNRGQTKMKETKVTYMSVYNWTYITTNNQKKKGKKAIKCYLFLLMLPRSHRLREDGLIYIPGVSPWRVKVSALFPTLVQLNNGGQQKSFLCLSLIFIILRAERVPFSF